MRKLILATIFLSGCVTEGQMQRTTADLNAAYAKSFHPMRYEHSRHNGVDVVRTVLAGQVGQSGLNAEQQQVVFKQIESGCGFPVDSFKEVRVVEHGPLSGYEVWVFDPQPQTNGPGTGVSVVFTYNPDTNMTKVAFSGPPQVCSWSESARGNRPK